MTDARSLARSVVLATLGSLAALATSTALAAGPGESSRELYRCGTTKWSWLSVVKIQRDWGSGSPETAYALQHVSDGKFALAYPTLVERLFEGPTLTTLARGARFAYVGEAPDGPGAGTVTLTLRKLARIQNEGVNHGINSGDVEATLTGSGAALAQVTERLTAQWARVADAFTYPDGAPTASRFFCMAAPR